MQYTGKLYFAFLIVVFYCYWLLPDRARWRTAFLTIASYLLYCLGGAVAVSILFLVSALNFIATRLMIDRRPGIRKLMLAASLSIDLGLLGVFKYWNFLVDSTPGWLAPAGTPVERLHLSLLAPVGISFFIFQSVGYVIDVYREDCRPADSFLDYLLFISFFPVIAAGPILRGRQFLPQLKRRLHLGADQGGRALFLILLGLIKKIAIADYLGA